MTTKTDYHSIMELKEQYNPCNRGFVNQYEANQIETVLEIKERSNIELQNVRDMAVMLYSRWADAEQEKANVQKALGLMDAMSAICFVIDQEKLKRRMEV